MGLLKKAMVEQAFGKFGMFGGAGSGKTYTASRLGMAISSLLGNKKPVAFFDTEPGSDFLVPAFEVEGIQLLVHKSRAFVDLLQVAREAEQSCSVLIVDSITHPWRDLMESFQRKNNLRRLEFHHWSLIKREWDQWTSFFLNSKVHIIVCGRLGYDYESQVNDETGKKEIIKAGTKMKAESEFGFEPSFLIEMERAERDAKPGSGWVHRAHVLKDRSDTINGKSFDFVKGRGGYKKGDWKTVYKPFEPIFKFLNIGGEHRGVDTGRSSEELFSTESGSNWKRIQEQKEIMLAEIEDVLEKHIPGRSDDAKRRKGDLVEKYAGTRTWQKIQSFRIEEVRALRDALWLELEKHPYGGTRVDGNDAKQDDDTPSFLQGAEQSVG